MSNIFDKPIRLLVTHQNPDLDAIGATWLFMRFAEKSFEEAELYYVPAGEEVNDDVLRAKELTRDEVIHVDTGMGQFDHHQPDNRKRDCATSKVYDYLAEKLSDFSKDEALKRMVEVINDVDHFGNCWWSEADHDRYEFNLESMIRGLRGGRGFTDHEMSDFTMICLDSVYNQMRQKVRAEEDLDSLGQEFESKWGKSLAIENKNEEVMKLAMKRGIMVVVRRDPDSKFVRIKAAPDREIDLTGIHDRIVEQDSVGTWYLHPSKAMLLNGSEHNPNHVPTPLNLEQVVKIVRSED